jgi:hypothetical protein
MLLRLWIVLWICNIAMRLYQMHEYKEAFRKWLFQAEAGKQKVVVIDVLIFVGVGAI